MSSTYEGPTIDVKAFTEPIKFLGGNEYKESVHIVCYEASKDPSSGYEFNLGFFFIRLSIPPPAHPKHIIYIDIQRSIEVFVTAHSQSRNVILLQQKVFKAPT